MTAVSPIIGIDLGTTNSLVAYCDAAGPRILASPTGERMLPSVCRFSDADGSLQAIGTQARAHAVEFPANTIHSIKRLMGRDIRDLPELVAASPYRIVQGAQRTARVAIGEFVLSPQEISACILRELRAWAENALGVEVSKAVVTVPAYFDDAQRQATRDAGRLAGLDIVRMVNEPTAATLAYNIGLGKSDAPLVSGRSGQRVSLSTKLRPQACTSGGAADGQGTLNHDQTVAIYDLGGGTFDISILRLRRTEQGTVDQVLATAGDTHLGGDDVDQMIIDLIQDEIRTQFGEAITFPPSTRQAFRQMAEATKIRLSQESQARIEIDLGEGRLYQRLLTRDALEAMIAPWIERTLHCCRHALRAASLTSEQIDRVVLVGGSTRIPAVRQAVADLFASEPYTALNPDEVVALGAAVQGAVLAGIHRDILLLDVIPLSLGIETMGGAVAKLITANTPIPARASEMFTTYAEGQTNVKIHVVQGERELVQDCRSLGEFDLRGIPPMPAGLPKLQVSFVVDANGILNVSAIEQRSGRRASIQVVPNHGLTRQEIEAMEKASVEYARQDMQAHRLIDLRNQARLDLRAITRQLERVGDQLPADTKAQIDTRMASVQRFLEEPNPDGDAFHEAIDAMDKASIPLAELAITQTLKSQ